LKIAETLIDPEAERALAGLPNRVMSYPSGRAWHDHRFGPVVEAHEMDFNHDRTAFPDATGNDPKPLTWSDSPPLGNADPILWEHEISAPAPKRATPGRGQIIAAALATVVFLGTGFAIGAPVYALSRWWASRPVTTIASETTVPVAVQAVSAPPTKEAPSSAAPTSAILLDEEVMRGSPPSEAIVTNAAAPPADITPVEPPTSTALPAATLTSEPPPTGPLQSEDPLFAVPTIDLPTIDPVAIDGVTIDPVTIDRVMIDPVVIDPVTIDHVTIDPISY
jgi:hypothetical protein